jgi:hypothetical protein
MGDWRGLAGPPNSERELLGRDDERSCSGDEPASAAAGMLNANDPRRDPSSFVGEMRSSSDDRRELDAAGDARTSSPAGESSACTLERAAVGECIALVSVAWRKYSRRPAPGACGVKSGEGGIAAGPALRSMARSVARRLGGFACAASGAVGNGGARVSVGERAASRTGSNPAGIVRRGAGGGATRGEKVRRHVRGGARAMSIAKAHAHAILRSTVRVDGDDDGRSTALDADRERREDVGRMRLSPGAAPRAA